MTAEIRNAYETYITLGQQIKELNTRRTTAQNVIKNYHRDTAQQLITEDGFKSQIIQQTTRSISVDRLIAKFGADAIADCYVETTKNNFRCDRILNG